MSVIYIFCCSVLVLNISLHFQTFILPLIVIIQWVFCLLKESDSSQCSTQRSDLIMSGMIWRNRTNWDRLNVQVDSAHWWWLRRSPPLVCKVLWVPRKAQPGLIKIRTSVHFLARPFLRILLHISLWLQREMSTEWR